jgi:hypothetical protein
MARSWPSAIAKAIIEAARAGQRFGDDVAHGLVDDVPEGRVTSLLGSGQRLRDLGVPSGWPLRMQRARNPCERTRARRGVGDIPS